MLEHETKRIIDLLTERTIGQEEVITLRKVLASAIPLGIKSYVQADLLQELRRELTMGPKMARVDFEAAGMHAVAKGFLRSCALEYSFTRAEYAATLNHAVHFLGNYLCRPRWTLRHFLFEQSETLSVSVLRERLEYVAEYPYFTTLLGNVLDRKEWTDISVDRCMDIVEKIDRQMMRQHSGRELAMLTKPIFDFLQLANAPGVDTIPMKPVALFFMDKEQAVLKEYIEQVCKIRGEEELSLADLIGLFDDLEAAQQQPVVVPQTILTEEVTGDEIIPPAAVPVENPETLNTGGNETPEAQESLFKDSLSSRAESTTVQQAAPHIRKDLRNLALSLTFSGLSERPVSMKPASLSSLISDKEEEFFIKELFDRDAAHYSGVIDALEKSETWKEASLYLNQFFHMNGLDPYADAVIQFTDIIHRRYLPEAPTAP